jgi:hypothetical protein
VKRVPTHRPNRLPTLQVRRHRKYDRTRDPAEVRFYSSLAWQNLRRLKRSLNA